ncbi:MAG: hypothetical protein E7575_07290 [Ruminococcaceae bacterium]|nr:hypothetical protein [Oscillospiraceae bacterium]
MKRIIAFLIVCACVLSCCVISAGANSNEEIADLLHNKVNSYLMYADGCGGYFAEGESPSAEAVVRYISPSLKNLFPDYGVKVSDRSYRFTIPGEEFENAVFTRFERSDALLSELRASDYRISASPSYYEITTQGTYMGTAPWNEFYGYIAGEDGTYICYETLGLPFIDEEDVYFPGEGDTAGKDYICIPIYEERDGAAVFTNSPMPYTGVLRAVLKPLGDALMIVSFESLSLSDLPGREDFDHIYYDDMSSEAFVQGILSGYGAYTDICSTPHSTVIAISSDLDENDSQLLDGALIDKAEQYRGISITISSLEGSIMENGAEFVFPVPDGGDLSCAYSFSLCRLEDDLTIRTVESVYDEESGTLTAVLYEGGLYAVCREYEEPERVLYGDVNGDGIISAVDCNLMNRIISGSLSLGSDIVNSAACDINGDGQVSAVDSNYLIRVVSGVLVL